MKLAVDLHSHSGYAGGVGQIDLSDVSRTMKKKGINVFGTGDSLFPPRTEELKEQLREVKPGLFALKNDSSLFLLQTEVILSTRIDGFKNKTIAHHVILFPDYNSITSLQKLMNKWKMKNTIGRPFITTDSQQEMEDRLFQIAEISPLIEIIPAHILTPDGILGSKNNLLSMKQFYGTFYDNLHAIETGLSADPAMLCQIPDLADLAFISNSDCHSAALNRIGREFTILDVGDVNYQSIITAIRENHIDMTAEFNPAEGRYFLTGHRSDRKGHQSSFLKDGMRENSICPQCGKKINLGVKDRAKQLSDPKIVAKNRNFKHLIPLVEVIAHSLNLKSISSKKVIKIFNRIMDIYPSEIDLWISKDSEELLDKWVPAETINQILEVKKSNFSFDPPGFDGNYGILRIGDRND